MTQDNVLDGLKEITLAIKAGSKDVFKTVYRVEYNNLLHFVYSYTGSRQDAEDIVQETMMAIWENRESLDPDRNFRSYLYTIARNKSLNFLRDGAKRPKGISIKDNTDAIINSLALCSHTVEEEINALELQGFIDRIYLSLPDNIVNTFKMSRQEGMTYNEIAQKLGITPKVVEYHIHITLKAFRFVLAKLGDEAVISTTK